jgi:site-specific DNA-methyltransferase (adenine-specific)
MLEHAIEATTFPGDIVLDCFAGSGSTAVAARKLRRRAVAIEIEPQWVRSIGMRLQADALKKGASGANESASPRQRQQPQLGLFAEMK